MDSSPDLDGLIDTVHATAPTDDPLVRLATASTVSSDLHLISDALLGHFVNQARGSGRSWSEISDTLGISKQATHKRFRHSVAERLTQTTVDLLGSRKPASLPPAAGVFNAALTSMSEMGHTKLGTEHVLLGLFSEPQGVAAQVLNRHGLTRQDVEQAIIARMPPRGKPHGEVPASQPAENILKIATSIALEQGHRHADGEHVLLALLRDPNTHAAITLTEHGLDEGAAQATINDIVNETT